MKNIFSVVLLMTSLLISNPIVAKELSAAEQLSDQLAAMQSMNAHFKQTIRDVDGVLLQQATGVLTVKRPRHFYWRTDEPYQHLIVTDGKTLWLYDIDLEQINRQVFNTNLDKAPALLLSGEIAAIDQQYTVKLVSSLEKNKSFSLAPKTADALFTELTVVFNDGLLTTMGLRDSFDQVTSIEFSIVVLNPEVADELFNFTPPEGIDVIIDEP